MVSCTGTESHDIEGTGNVNSPRTRGREGRSPVRTCAGALALALALSLLPAGSLTACGGDSGSGSGGSGSGSGSGGGSSAPTGAAYAQPATVVTPTTTLAPGSTGIDTSGISEGWVCAAAASTARLKFQIVTDAGTYNYDLPNDGTPTIYPLNMGNGSYNFRIMQNTEGSSYVELYSERATVTLSSEFAPYLKPGIFCAYTADSACVAKARELTADATNEAEAVANVCTWVAKNVKYDYPKAKELMATTGYIPDPDDTLATGTGICFDYASLSAAMLRSMGIPTKILTGYVGADEVYHAWIMVYIDGTWQTAKFSVSPNEWSRCDVTFASTGATATVGSGSGYTDRYTY